MSDKTQNKDGLALVVGGIFILALVFATYNYFNKGDTVDILQRASQETTGKTGDIDGNGVATEQGSPGDLGTGGPTTQYSNIRAWIANDYVQGQIKGNTHKVIWGDTLWEIAEGAYGEPTQWTKLLEANKENVGSLPNGVQALIVEGQILVVPR